MVSKDDKAPETVASGSGILKTNPRGIPAAPFITNVEEHVGGPDVEAESALAQFQEAIAKYKYMESNLSQRKRGLSERLPDMRKTLAIVEFLHERREGKQKATPEDAEKEDDLDDDLEEDAEEDSKKPLVTTFELNDTLYAQAELMETDLVYLWLGANTMLAYPIPEALTLLRTRIDKTQASLEECVEDLEFLREQVTVMEVNLARTYNWDVKRRREKREREGPGMGEKG